MYYELDLANGVAYFEAKPFHVWCNVKGYKVGLNRETRMKQLQEWTDESRLAEGLPLEHIIDWQMLDEVPFAK
jgi:hypothetical protein